MKPKFKFIHLFWNPEQNRFRTFWRLTIHSALYNLLTTILPLIVILALALVDRITGMGLRTGGDEMIFLQDLVGSWLGSAVMPIMTLLIIILVTYFVGHFIDRRSFKSFGLDFSPRWWRDFSFGLCLGAFLMGLIFLFGWLSGIYTISGFFQSRNGSSSFVTGFIQTLILFMCVGIYEELLSRGYHLVNLAEGLNSSKIGKVVALILAWVLSATVFGLLHMNNPNATWVSTLNIILAGLFLGLGMVLTGQLAIPIGLHITWNFFQGVVFGFPVSGMNIGSAVIATRAVGPEWITGGRFGPEAGVIGLAAILLGSVLTLLWVRLRGRLQLETHLVEYQSATERSADEKLIDPMQP